MRDALVGFWDARVEAVVSAAAEALFPPNDVGAPDWIDTDIVARTAEYLAVLPPAQRQLIKLMFTAVEMAPVAFGGGLKRFSSLSLEERQAMIRGWRSSPVFPVKVLGDSVKAQLTMMYFSHPAALDHIGYFKRCENPGDPMQVPIRPGNIGEVAP